MELPVGSAINAAAVVTGGAIGALIVNKMSGRLKQALFLALSLAIMAMGAKLAVDYQNVFCLPLAWCWARLLAL